MTKDSTPGRSAYALGVPGGVAPSLRAPAALSVGHATLRNRVFLAPLSGITDVPFRRLARRFGAGLVVSEMIASGELVKGDGDSLRRALRDGEGPHAVQLAGRDPRWMREAARVLAGDGADIIDINMGCPAKKVVGGQSGSALMREPDLALRLVEATVEGAWSVPVTLKMRLGWDRGSMNAAEIAVRAEDAGVRMITVHGRTREEFYEGRADWRAIRAVKAAVAVPVVANGDLCEPADRRRMLAESGADAVMIGRAARGRPWLPGLVAGQAALAGEAAADLVCEHYEAMLSHYGRPGGVRQARKHLGWYIDRFAAAVAPEPAGLRAALMGACDPAPVLQAVRRWLAGVSLADLEPAAAARARAA